MEEVIRAAGPHAAAAHDAVRRGTAERVAASFGAAPLAPAEPPPYDDGGLVRPAKLIRPGLLKV